MKKLLFMLISITLLSGFSHGAITYDNGEYNVISTFINDDVWAAVTPMLATTGGRINLLSTPDLGKGKTGYFYKCSFDEDFMFKSISTLDVAEKRKEPQRSAMLKHAQKERGRLSKAQFAAEYLGQFVDAMMQVFPNEWIDRVLEVVREHPQHVFQFLTKQHYYNR